MLQEEESKPGIYKISFTMEEIRPLIIRYIDIAQDHNSPNSLWNLKDYKYYHEQLKEHYIKIGKEPKPSMADKLAYIVLLSNSKRKIIESESVEDFKLFRDDRQPDFKINQVIEAEYNENDDDHEDFIDCICSYQNLKIVYYVENIDTGIVLHVGCECIKKSKLVSKEEFESKQKLFKEITSKKKERQLELELGFPLGYYEQQRQLDKKRKQAEKKLKKKEKQQPKIDSGNYRWCYLCDDSLMNIKNERNKRFCDHCIENDSRAKLIKEYYNLLLELKLIYKRFNCNNCDTPFISLFSNSEYLCKNCVKDNKVITCKICKTHVLLDIDSNDIYCGECEEKIINCLDCNEETIRQKDDSNRCETCQLCYDNKKILEKCIECNEEFVRNQKECWKTYCKECFTNIEYPECKCLKKMVQRTVKKEGANKGRKFYACRDRTCNEFIWG